MSPGQRKRWTRLLAVVSKRMALVAAGVLIALLMLELAVRASGWAPVPRPRKEGKYNQKCSDPELRFVNRPGGRHTIYFVDRVGASPRIVVHNVNDLGWRGAEVDRAKAAGLWRIACLGDSYTFGYGVNDEETWPAALQRELDHAPLDHPVEVLNFGVAAYDTEQEIALLKKRVIQFDPDVVLLAWCFNDPVLSGRRAGSEPRQPPFLISLLDPNSDGLLGTLRSVSRLLDLVARHVHKNLYSANFRRRMASVYEDTHPGWQRCKAALLSARDFCAARDVSFVVVLYPYLAAVGDHLVTTGPYSKVQAFCRQASIPLLDLEPAYAGRALAQLRAHARDAHPNGEAHTIAASEIARFLTSAKLLGSERE